MGVQQPSLQFRQRRWRGHKQVWVLECCPCMRSHSCQRKAASSSTAAIRELVRLKLALHLKMECVGVFLHALVWRGSTIQDKGIISNRDGGTGPSHFQKPTFVPLPTFKASVLFAQPDLSKHCDYNQEKLWVYENVDTLVWVTFGYYWQ